jgi:hypothetical protein
MKCSNWFRQIAPTISLIGSLLLVSCSEEPAPGPISPIKPADKLTSSKQTPNQSTSGAVRPVNRLESSDRNALAKSGYSEPKVLQQLQEVRDELKAIADNNPCTYLAYKLNSAVDETNGAMTKLAYSSSDNGDSQALHKIGKAKARVQEAINYGWLSSAQGGQFLSQYATIESQIQAGSSPSSDCRGSSKSLWIKRTQGGLIAFCGHSIKVPKYATKQDAEFSINISPNDYITVDFGPDGWFDQEVTVTISYKDADLTGIDPTKLTLAWYDESTGQWVDLGGTVDLKNKTVTAKAKHFTQYTISSK